MRRALFAQAQGNVLDAACGQGMNFTYLSNATRIAGVDFSPVMLGMAHARQLGVKVELHWKAAGPNGSTN